LCIRVTATRSAEDEESFKDSKRIKLKRESAFMHRALQVIAEAERRPFGGFESKEAQEGKHFRRTQIEAVSTGFVVGAKAEAFDTLEIFQGGGRNRKLDKEHSCCQIRPRKRSGPLRFHVQVAAAGVHR
jgi:hypothetical protein